MTQTRVQNPKCYGSGIIGEYQKMNLKTDVIKPPFLINYDLPGGSICGTAEQISAFIEIYKYLFNDVVQGSQLPKLHFRRRLVLVLVCLVLRMGEWESLCFFKD